MQVVYDPLPQKNRESLCQCHPRGYELVLAIETDLSRDPETRAQKLANGRLAQVYTPPVLPRVRILVSYLTGKVVLIYVFDWKIVE